MCRLVGGERALSQVLEIKHMNGASVIKLRPKLESKLKSKLEPESIKASEIIRGFKFKQIREVFADGKGGYCVMGGLLKYFGAKDKDLVEGYGGTPMEIIERVYSKIGNNRDSQFDNWDDLVMMNNTGSNWEQLADFLAQQGL